MRLCELLENAGYYEPENDNVGIRKLTDTRKPRLTLKALNRLKKLRSAKKLEKIKKSQITKIIYSDNNSETSNF